MTDAPKDLNDALDKADMNFTDWHVNRVNAAYLRAAYLRGLEDAAKKAERMPYGDGWERRIAAAIRALAKEKRK